MPCWKLQGWCDGEDKPRMTSIVYHPVLVANAVSMMLHQGVDHVRISEIDEEEAETVLVDTGTFFVEVPKKHSSTEGKTT